MIHLHVSQNEQFDIRKSMSPRHSPKDTGNKIDISKPTVVLISAAGQQSSGGCTSCRTSTLGTAAGHGNSDQFLIHGMRNNDAGSDRVNQDFWDRLGEFSKKT